MRSTSASATSTSPASSHRVARAQPLGRLGRRRAFAPDRDQAAQLGAERAPPALLRAGADQLRPDLLQAVLQLLQRHRLARGGDDRADRLRLGLAEALAQQRLEKAQGDAAIERAARGEGDQQALGAVGIADRRARLGVDLADPSLERGDAAGDLRIDDDPLGLAGGIRRPRPAAAAGSRLDRRRRDRRGAACGAGAGAMPIMRAPASQLASSQPIAPRPSRKKSPGSSSQAKQRPPRRRGRPVVDRGRNRRSFARQSGTAWRQAPARPRRAASAAIATDRQPSPAAAAAAALIAASRIAVALGPGEARRTARAARGEWSRTRAPSSSAASACGAGARPRSAA